MILCSWSRSQLCFKIALQDKYLSIYEPVLFLKFIFIYVFVCVCRSVCLCVPVCVIRVWVSVYVGLCVCLCCPCVVIVRGEKRVLDSPQLELQTAVSYSMWAAGCPGTLHPRVLVCLSQGWGVRGIGGSILHLWQYFFLSKNFVSLLMVFRTPLFCPVLGCHSWSHHWLTAFPRACICAYHGLEEGVSHQSPPLCLRPLPCLSGGQSPACKVSSRRFQQV